MSNTPKKITATPNRKTASARRLRRKGERVTLDYGDRLGVGHLLDGTAYRDPGISNRGTAVRENVSVIRDGGASFDRS